MKLKPVPAGLAAAALGTALFLLYARRMEIETAGGDRIDVLVAVSKIERGTSLKEDLLTTRSIPQAFVDDRMVRASEREQVLGLKAAEPVGVSQAVLWSDVVTTREEKRDLSALVQPGYRAVSAPFAANPSFSLIRPGDFVDVLSIVAQGRGDERDAIVLLQRVLVLAIGNDLSGGAAKGKPASTQAPTLTLSLDLPEAQMLSLAAQRGPLAVALRNPNDQRVTDNPATLDSSELDDPAVRERVGAARHGSGIARVPSKL